MAHQVMVIRVVNDHIHDADTLVCQCLLHHRLDFGGARCSQPLGTERFSVLDKIHAAQINTL